VTCVDLYALLQFGEDSEYGRKAHNDYFKVFHALLVEDESSPLASGNFQSAAACDDTKSEEADGSIGSTVKQGCCPGGVEIDLPRVAWPKAAEAIKDKNLI
jgi:hypothetical protein